MSLESMNRAECLRCLEQSRVGRVGITVEALPVILPVNFAVLEGSIYFTTVPGTKLAAAVNETIVAFQSDAYASNGSAGWSVLAVGRCSRETESETIERFRQAAVTAWPFGDRAEHLVRIEPTNVTGRRFGDISNPLVWSN